MDEDGAVTTIDSAYLPPPVPELSESSPLDLRSILASEWTRDRLAMIAANSPRSLQAKAGPSEIGQECPRRLGYRIAGTPVVNAPDPLKAMFGTGLHHVIAEGLRALDPGGARYLLEHAVHYRNVTGTVDLFDRTLRRMIDWKSTALDRIRKYRHSGIPTNYLVQTQIYAAGLAAQGESVDTIALVFVPRDGTLSDVWAWTTTPDRDRADKAIDRYEGIERALEEDGGPASLEAVPSALCPWCPNYRPNATDLSIACPGKVSP